MSTLFGRMPLLAFAALVVLAVSLIDIARRTIASWEASGYSQLAWIAVVVLIPIVGGPVCLGEIRPVLVEMTHLRSRMDGRS